MAPLPPDAAFCGVCGTRAPRLTDTGLGFCTACGASLTRAAPFCNECGAKIPGYIYAGFWRRLGATLLDLLIGFGAALIPAVVVGAIAGNGAASDRPTTDEEKFAGLVFAAVFALVLWSVLLAYLWVMNSRGGTFGKRVLSLRVVSLEHGGSIGLGQGFVRTIVWYIGTQTPFLIAWLWMVWDEKKQTLHDKAARSVVIKIR